MYTPAYPRHCMDMLYQCCFMYLYLFIKAKKADLTTDIIYYVNGLHSHIKLIQSTMSLTLNKMQILKYVTKITNLIFMRNLYSHIFDAVKGCIFLTMMHCVFHKLNIPILRRHDSNSSLMRSVIFIIYLTAYGLCIQLK